MKADYQITRKRHGHRGMNQDLTVKMTDGSTITEEKTKLEKWKENIQQLLSRCYPPTLADISVAEQDQDIERGPITVQVKNAIKKLMNIKKQGDNNLYAEMLKAEQKMPQILQHIIQDNEMIPDTWKRGTIIRLPKKGNLSECNNWRGITLLSITSKAYSRIILQRITTAVDKLLCHE